MLFSKRVVYHEFHETCHSVNILFHEQRLQTMLWDHSAWINSRQRWKQTRFRVCFHLWCELTTTMNVTGRQVSWNSGRCRWKLSVRTHFASKASFAIYLARYRIKSAAKLSHLSSKQIMVYMKKCMTGSLYSLDHCAWWLHGNCVLCSRCSCIVYY